MTVYLVHGSVMVRKTVLMVLMKPTVEIMVNNWALPWLRLFSVNSGLLLTLIFLVHLNCKFRYFLEN